MPYKGDKGDKNAARPPEGSLVETRCLIKGPKSAIVPFPGPRSGPKSRTYAFTFLTPNVFGCFRGVMSQFECIRVIKLWCTFIFEAFKSHTEWSNTLSVISLNTTIITVTAGAITAWITSVTSYKRHYQPHNKILQNFWLTLVIGRFTTT